MPNSKTGKEYRKESGNTTKADGGEEAPFDEGDGTTVNVENTTSGSTTATNKPDQTTMPAKEQETASTAKEQETDNSTTEKQETATTTEPTTVSTTLGEHDTPYIPVP